MRKYKIFVYYNSGRVLNSDILLEESEGQLDRMVKIINDLVSRSDMSLRSLHVQDEIGIMHYINFAFVESVSIQVLD